MTSEEYMKAALAALAGAGDEATFGLSNKYVPGAKALTDEYPKSATTGRVASYFVPGLGEFEALGASKLAAKIPGLAKRAGETGMKAAGRAMGRGGASAAWTATAPALLKKLIGTNDKGPEDVGRQTLLGAGLGLAGHGAQALAGKVYNHPALMDRYHSEKSLDQGKQLMEEGVWGGGGTFRRKGEELKGAMDEARSAILPKMQQRGARVSVRPVLAHGREKIGSIATEPSEATAVGDSLRDMLRKLRPSFDGRIPFSEADDALHQVNAEVAKQTPRIRGNMFGNQGADVTDKMDRLGLKRKALNDMIGNGIKEFGDPGDHGAWQAARATYRRGQDLLGNLRVHEGKEMATNPHFSQDAWHKVFGATAGSLPVRTGMGVAMDRAAPEVVAKVGTQLNNLRHKKSSTDDGESLNQYIVTQHQGKGEPLATVERAPEAQGEDNPFLSELDHGAAPAPVRQISPAKAPGMATPQKTGGSGNIFLDELGN